MDFPDKIYVDMCSGVEYKIDINKEANATREVGVFVKHKSNSVIKEYVPYDGVIEFNKFNSVSEVYEFFKQHDLILKCVNGDVHHFYFTYDYKRIMLDGADVELIAYKNNSLHVECSLTKGYNFDDKCILKNVELKSYSGIIYQSTLRKTYLEKRNKHDRD